MELLFYKKAERNGLNEMITYYVTNGEKTTLILMNENEPIRYIVSSMPGSIEVSEKHIPIDKNEFLAAAVKSNNDICWYVDQVNK